MTLQGSPSNQDKPEPSVKGGTSTTKLANLKHLSNVMHKLDFLFGSQGAGGLFVDEELSEGIIADPADTIARHRRLVSLIRWQAVAIGVLVCVLILVAPALRPIMKYRALTPKGEYVDLVPLSMPNLTNQSVLSWAANSVTEIMTLGFGDFEKQIYAQRERFTTAGWDSYIAALREKEVYTTFQQRQLVLTTVPSDTPVITSQGLDENKEYFWKIEVPIVMNYITNNEVTRKQNGIVKLTIVRVPGSENVNGIAIKSWVIH